MIKFWDALGRPNYSGIQILGSTTVTTPFYTVKDSGTYAFMPILPSGKTGDSVIKFWDVPGRSNYPGIQIFGSTTVTTPFYTVKDGGTYAAMLILPSGEIRDSFIKFWDVLGRPNYPGIQILGSTTVTTPFFTVTDSGTYASMPILSSVKTGDSVIKFWDVLGR